MESPARLTVFVGFTPNEMRASVVAEQSIRVRCAVYPDVARIGRTTLRNLYSRKTTEKNGLLWDVISDAPMSTDHAIARFFIPYLCGYQGWALFTDGDILLRHDLADLMAVANEQYAVMCVQHPPFTANEPKKNGAPQLVYPRKNWSSVMLINCGHPGAKRLSLDVVNEWTGRDLHGFAWLRDDEIGALDPTWNYLVNVSAPMTDPALVHFTEGTPDLPGHGSDPFADEWRAMAAQSGFRLPLATGGHVGLG